MLITNEMVKKIEEILKRDNSLEIRKRKNDVVIIELNRDNQRIFPLGEQC